MKIIPPRGACRRHAGVGAGHAGTGNNDNQRLDDGTGRSGRRLSAVPSGAIMGTLPPGVKPVYVQAPSPDEAYPAPPPLAHYPICKPGQFDKCLERNSPK